METSMRYIVRVNGLPVVGHYGLTGRVTIDLVKDARPLAFNKEHKARRIAELINGKAFKITETWEEEELSNDSNSET